MWQTGSYGVLSSSLLHAKVVPCYTGQLAVSIFRPTPYRAFVACYASQLSAQLHAYSISKWQHTCYTGRIATHHQFATLYFYPRSSEPVNLKPKLEILFQLWFWFWKTHLLAHKQSSFVSFSVSKTRISLPSTLKDCWDAILFVYTASISRKKNGRAWSIAT